MDKECLATVMPSYVVTIFWIFLSVIMLAVIAALIFIGLNVFIEVYQTKREDYLRNKKLKIELELLGKQKNGN